jgi:transcriptional regulator with PAS, ATPase and Fis domain
LWRASFSATKPGLSRARSGRKRGKFEAAHTGTLFLDEIGELSPASQARLLHVLQEREVERLGGEGRRISVDVRVIAATNRDLETMVEEGTFREDLFFRLNVFAIRTPALRDRREDIPALARHFAFQSADMAGRPIQGISEEVLQEFKRHSWPGNVRQLENVVQRAVAMGEAELILLEDLPPDFLLSKARKAPARVRNIHEALEETAREVCIAAFTVSRGDCAAAAQLMGVHRSSMYRLIRRHGLEHLLLDS